MTSILQKSNSSLQDDPEEEALISKALFCLEKRLRYDAAHPLNNSRDVVKRAFEHHATKISIAHNHPSNPCNPSPADEEITQRLKKILSLVDAQWVDPIVVSHEAVYSFAE